MESKGCEDRFILHWYVLKIICKGFTAFLNRTKREHFSIGTFNERLTNNLPGLMIQEHTEFFGY